MCLIVIGVIALVVHTRLVIDNNKKHTQTHQGNSFPAGHGKRNVFQDQSFREVTESDVVKFDRAFSNHQRPRSGRVDYFLLFFQQIEHVFHVDEILLNRPVTENMFTLFTYTTKFIKF